MQDKFYSYILSKAIFWVLFGSVRMNINGKTKIIPSEMNSGK